MRSALRATGPESAAKAERSRTRAATPKWGACRGRRAVSLASSSPPGYSAPGVRVIFGGSDAGADVADAGVTVRLAPGEEAFGCEGHATTRCLLAFLAREVRSHPGPALDYGAGCGVLGLAAFLLGSRPVTGVENQRDAVATARLNASLNGVPWGGPRGFAVLEPSEFAPAPAGGAHAVLAVANMLVGPLVTVAPDIAAATRPGARVALTGFRRREVATVLAAYAPYLDLDPAPNPVPCDPDHDDDGQHPHGGDAWVALFATRNAVAVSTALRSDQAVS